MELENDEWIDFAVDLINNHILKIDDVQKQASVCSFMLGVVAALYADNEDHYTEVINQHAQAMKDLYPTLAANTETHQLM